MKNYVHTLDATAAEIDPTVAATIGPTAVGEMYVSSDGVVYLVTAVGGNNLASTTVKLTVL